MPFCDIAEWCSSYIETTPSEGNLEYLDKHEKKSKNSNNCVMWHDLTVHKQNKSFCQRYQRINFINLKF